MKVIIVVSNYQIIFYKKKVWKMVTFQYLVPVGSQNYKWMLNFLFYFHNTFIANFLLNFPMVDITTWAISQDLT